MAAAKVDLFFLAITLFAFFAKTIFAEVGTATFYTPPYTPSACYGFQDDGVMIAAASDLFWNNGAACGDMYVVRCTGPITPERANPCIGTDAVLVRIVDHCPPLSCRGTIDLSQEVFGGIANPDAGIIKIEYHRQ